MNYYLIMNDFQLVCTVKALFHSIWASGSPRMLDTHQDADCDAIWSDCLIKLGPGAGVVVGATGAGCGLTRLIGTGSDGILKAASAAENNGNIGHSNELKV